VKILSWPGHRLIALLLRIYLGGVFVQASLHKIANPGAFALDVATYDILPLSLVNAMAIVLPWIEIVAGGLLIVGLFARPAAWLTSAMMLVFLAALLVALHGGLDISCGCFASSSMTADDLISFQTVLRDFAWLLIGVYVLIFDTRPLGVDYWLEKEKKEEVPHA